MDSKINNNAASASNPTNAQTLKSSPNSESGQKSKSHQNITSSKNSTTPHSVPKPSSAKINPVVKKVLIVGGLLGTLLVVSIMCRLLVCKSFAKTDDEELVYWGKNNLQNANLVEFEPYESKGTV